MYSEMTPKRIRRFVRVSRGHGYTMSDIAAYLGVSRAAVYDWLKLAPAKQPTLDKLFDYCFKTEDNPDDPS